ncbi:MAG: stage III sporulation protein AF [Oscillospiraceae bacterium]|jgi:hypothetical protein
MNIIREIGISICVTAVATAVFHGLMPNSTLEKTARFVLSLFFLCCLILPFTHYDFSDIEALTAYQTGDSPVNSESLQQTVNRKLNEMSEQAVRQTVKSILEQNGIVPQEIAVETNIEDNNCISISKVIVTVKPEDETAAQALVPSLTTGEETTVEVRVQAT